MSDTPARDALAEKLERWCGDCNLSPDCEACRQSGIDAVKWLAPHPSLVVAALVESGWHPSDDDLRAMGGKPEWHDRSNRCWRFPEDGER